MMLLSVAGYKDCGKSSLCRELLALFLKRGYSVGYIKRTQESVSSPVCTDSGAVSALGVDALLWGEDAFRYEHFKEGARESDARTVAGKFFPDADIVVLEGGKELHLPKIWVLGEGECVPDCPGIFAVYDRYGPGNGKERYGKGEYERLVSDISRMTPKKSTRIYIADRELPLNAFVNNFISKSIMGMLSSLKNSTDEGSGEEIRIYMRNDVDER